MKWVQKHLTIVIRIVALLVIAGALLLFESDQLWKVQEKNLFFCTTLFLREQLVVPGGLLTWIGRFFTQFLYYPWLGVSLLCAWWYLLMSLTKRTFRIPDRWTVLLLIPVVILLISNMDMGYWIYVLKLKGLFFVTTIGTTIVVALLWVFRKIPDQYCLRAVYILLTTIIGYPLFGIYGLVAALLMALWSWRLSAHRMNAIACSVAAVAGVAAVPLFCYRFVYYQTNLVNILWAELPVFITTEEYPAYFIPYYLLALFFVILIVRYHDDRQEVRPMRKSYYLACQAALTILMVGCVYHFWMKDENFHHELTMQHRIAQCDWTGVLEEAAAQEDEPTRSIVMMRNIALSRIGRQGDDMFLYKNGSKMYAAPFMMRLMLVVGPQVYYQYGMLNYCNRLCMEVGVLFGFGVEDYRLLASCALLNGDKPLARKYIGALRKTLFYRDWAEKAEALLDHPELIAQDAEREPITHMLHYKNSLGGDQGNTERYIMTELANSTDTTDPVFQEQCLLATLWTKNINQFWYHFKEYALRHPRGPIPRYYQEAAYLYGRKERRPEVEAMPFDTSVKESFRRFMSVAPNYYNEDMEVVRQGLYPLFGDTYYYDYYAMKQLPEY
ncbi:MAG: hypothetical protein IJ888_11025 [Prevotella sp.]|nr:hypothetical protein [Prevotella sp.]